MEMIELLYKYLESESFARKVLHAHNLYYSAQKLNHVHGNPLRLNDME